MPLHCIALSSQVSSTYPCERPKRLSNWGKKRKDRGINLKLQKYRNHIRTRTRSDLSVACSFQSFQPITTTLTHLCGTVQQTNTGSISGAQQARQLVGRVPGVSAAIPPPHTHSTFLIRYINHSHPPLIPASSLCPQDKI